VQRAHRKPSDLLLEGNRITQTGKVTLEIRVSGFQYICMLMISWAGCVKLKFLMGD
jgi:hypothetical protein